MIPNICQQYKQQNKIEYNSWYLSISASEQIIENLRRTLQFFFLDLTAHKGTPSYRSLFTKGEW